MDWAANWNQALDDLEAQLTGEIDLEKTARLAGCSVYQFQRMFSCLTGISVGEYLRRRRMTLAAADLQAGKRVLDTALQYGYASPTAFNRAFQAVHGIPPSVAAQEGVKLKSFPRIRFKFVLKGASEMEYQIVKRNAFRIVGYRMPLPSDVDENFRSIPAFWEANSHRVPALLPLMNTDLKGVLGVCTWHQDRENFYYIAAASTAPAADDMAEEIIPAGTWAVFSGSGAMPDAIQTLQKRMISEWLPDSGYEWTQAPDIEVYLDVSHPPVADFQVWLPVRRKPQQTQG